MHFREQVEGLVEVHSALRDAKIARDAEELKSSAVARDSVLALKERRKTQAKEDAVAKRELFAQVAETKKAIKEAECAFEKNALKEAAATRQKELEARAERVKAGQAERALKREAFKSYIDTKKAIKQEDEAYERTLIADAKAEREKEKLLKQKQVRERSLAARKEREVRKAEREAELARRRAEAAEARRLLREQTAAKKIESEERARKKKEERAKQLEERRANLEEAKALREKAKRLTIEDEHAKINARAEQARALREHQEQARVDAIKRVHGEKRAAAVCAQQMPQGPPIPPPNK